MRDVLARTGAWFDEGRPFALATVVRTWGSSPRQPGAAMAVGEDGEVVGSVSGGCVEGAVHEVAQRVLAEGVPCLVTYGVSDDDAFAVGLTCGGTLQVFVERVDAASFPVYGRVRDAVAARRGLAVATVLQGPAGAPVGGHLVVTTDPPSASQGSGDESGHDELGTELGHAVTGAVRGALGHGETGVVLTGAPGPAAEGAVAVFVEALPPPPTVFVYGAVDFAGALVRAAKLLGHHVVVCDARGLFATTRRFPDADEVVVAWPHEHLLTAEVDERSVVCVLTHDPKFDVPLLALALRGRAGYVGAMGNRTTHQDRLARLREVGVDEEALARLHSPIGLDLGARTPEETAVSILAEVIATTRGGTGVSLRDVDTAIHRSPGASAGAARQGQRPAAVKARASASQGSSAHRTREG